MFSKLKRHTGFIIRLVSIEGKMSMFPPVHWFLLRSFLTATERSIKTKSKYSKQIFYPIKLLNHRILHILAAPIFSLNFISCDAYLKIFQRYQLFNKVSNRILYILETSKYSPFFDSPNNTNIFSRFYHAKLMCLVGITRHYDYPTANKYFMMLKNLPQFSFSNIYYATFKIHLCLSVPY